MLNLETVLKLEDIVSMHNVAEHLTEDENKKIAKHVIDTFELDRMSRSQWEHDMAQANKLALQIKEEKSFPWPGAANVKFPLTTIACLQYQSRAYASLIDPPEVVRYVPQGSDPQSEKFKAANLISEHMNWQLMEEDDQWEAEMDRSQMVQPLMGCVIKKVYFDPVKKHNVSECVLPQDFVINYYTKSLETSTRFTHILTWSHNRLAEQIARKMVLEPESLEAPRIMPILFGELQTVTDVRQGLTQTASDPDQPFIVLEQHTELDLDDDGYKEPYVIFVKYDSQELLAIRPRFLPSGIEKEKIEGVERLIRIVPEKFFIKYPFIPSPDGGFYDLGFGKLLGPLNESINTAINQLFDAGTLKNAGGGFIGRGVRSKSGEVQMRPALWMRVDSVGDDLRKNIVPLPVPEPSTVLFQLLSLLIDYGQRVAGAPDVVQGQNPGQNTPAETSRNMVEQGMKIFSGIYKRTYRSLRDEFRMIFRLNQLYLEESQSFHSPSTGQEMRMLAELYRLPSTAIRPAADPNYISDAQRMNQATALMQAATTQPGFDRYEVTKFYLKALRIPGADTFFPDPKGPRAVPPPPNPKIQVEQLKMQAKQMQLKQDMQIKLFKLMEDHRVNDAKIKQMEAQALSLMSGIQSDQHGQKIAELDAMLGMAKHQQDARSETIKMLHDVVVSMHELQDTDQQREQDGQLKQQEMDQQKILAQQQPQGSAPQ